jgi:hypothetical protein
VPTVRHHLHVAELAGHPVAAAVDASVEDERAADAGAERHDDGVPGTASRTVRVLGPGRAVGVVVERDDGPPAGGEAGPHLLAAPREVRREHDALALGVDEPGRRDAHPVHA